MSLPFYPEASDALQRLYSPSDGDSPGDASELAALEALALAAAAAATDDDDDDNHSSHMPLLHTEEPLRSYAAAAAEHIAPAAAAPPGGAGQAAAGLAAAPQQRSEAHEEPEEEAEEAEQEQEAEALAEDDTTSEEAGEAPPQLEMEGKITYTHPGREGSQAFVILGKDIYVPSGVLHKLPMLRKGDWLRVKAIAHVAGQNNYRALAVLDYLPRSGKEDGVGGGVGGGGGGKDRENGGGKEHKEPRDKRAAGGGGAGGGSGGGGGKKQSSSSTAHRRQGSGGGSGGDKGNTHANHHINSHNTHSNHSSPNGSPPTSGSKPVVVVKKKSGDGISPPSSYKANSADIVDEKALAAETLHSWMKNKANTPDSRISTSRLQNFFSAYPNLKPIIGKISKFIRDFPDLFHWDESQQIIVCS